MMKRLLLACVAGLLSLFSIGARAQHNDIYVHVVLMPLAKAWLNSTGNSNYQAWIDGLISDINKANTSGNGGAMVTTYKALPVDSTGNCCGFGALFLAPPQGISITDAVARDTRIMGTRDFNDGDITLVIGKTGLSDVRGASNVDCSQPQATAPFRAVVGLNIDFVGNMQSEISRWLSRASCAQEEGAPTGTARGYSWLEGSGATCSVFRTINSNITSYSALTWTVTNPTIAITPGYDQVVDVAALNMTQNCPQQSGYTCSQLSSCLINGTGTTGSCPYSLTHAGFTQNVTGSIGNASQTTITCNNIVQLQWHSNPLRSFHGHPMGDATHDAASTVDGNFAAVKALHNTKVAKALLEGTR